MTQKKKNEKVVEDKDKLTKAKADANHKALMSAADKINAYMSKKGIDDKAITFLTEDEMDIERISSGSFVFDSIIGGGIPVGRIIEIYGKEASGKTSIALNAAADVQRKGGNVLFVDAEQALSPDYASTLGVDMSRLAISQLSVAEDVFDLLTAAILSGATNLIIVDSVASLIPRAEFEEEGKVTMGLLARIMSSRLRNLVQHAKKHNVTVIFLNQTREKIGVMYGDPTTTPGGNALKFYASLRVRVNRSKILKEGTKEIGTEVRLKVDKNKVAPPFQVGLTVLTFAHGINLPAEIIETGEEIGVFEKSGRSFYFKPSYAIKLNGGIATYMEEGEFNGYIKIATSKADAIVALEDNEELLKDMQQAAEVIMKARRQGMPLKAEVVENEVDGIAEALDDIEELGKVDMEIE